MNKKEFLKALEHELIEQKTEDAANVLEYYEEFIEDQKESGKKEKDIISKLSINEITKNIKVQTKIDNAIKKPTLSNGVKALIAFLSILSLPMLIGVGGIAFGVVITILALIFALIVTVGSIFFAGIVSIIALIAASLTGKLPISTSIFCVGIALILIGFSTILIKWSIKIFKEMIVGSINILKNQVSKRKETKNNE